MAAHLRAGASATERVVCPAEDLLAASPFEECRLAQTVGEAQGNNDLQKNPASTETRPAVEATQDAAVYEPVEVG
jgi:hypothetical protein